MNAIAKRDEAPGDPIQGARLLLGGVARRSLHLWSGTASVLKLSPCSPWSL